jgi:hypothetical protein
MAFSKTVRRLGPKETGPPSWGRLPRQCRASAMFCPGGVSSLRRFLAAAEDFNDTNAPERLPMICVSIGRGRHRHMIAEHKHLAEEGAKLVELRLDYIAGEVNLRRLLAERPCPVAVACRRPQDGGRVNGLFLLVARRKQNALFLEGPLDLFLGQDVAKRQTIAFEKRCKDETKRTCQRPRAGRLGSVCGAARRGAGSAVAARLAGTRAPQLRRGTAGGHHGAGCARNPRD